MGGTRGEPGERAGVLASGLRDTGQLVGVERVDPCRQAGEERTQAGAGGLDLAVGRDGVLVAAVRRQRGVRARVEHLMVGADVVPTGDDCVGSRAVVGADRTWLAGPHGVLVERGLEPGDVGGQPLQRVDVGAGGQRLVQVAGVPPGEHVGHRAASMSAVNARSVRVVVKPRRSYIVTAVVLPPST